MKDRNKIDHPRNKRKPFAVILEEFAVTANPVTKSVRREILKGRLDRNDVE